jgi:cellulose synthase/poly-beta-1,6-N-acetylglucosamine synthase-like glycosyltransferase
VRLTAVVPATDRPPGLARVRAAIEAADSPPEQLIVVELPERSSPAAARNAAARHASGDVLVFVDSDVLVHRDTFRRIRERFEADPGLTAVFGSYDDAPECRNVVSVFRNLLHHHVHQGSIGPALTFWSGLGAIRRDAFLAAGGFDGDRVAIEDIELGMRLAAAGARIELDPAILGTHVKSWSLPQMVRTDLRVRGVPWVSLLLRWRLLPATLNLGWRHRLSALASLALVVAIALFEPLLAGGALATLVGLNRSFYRLLWRAAGPRTALVGPLLHMLHLLTAAAAIPVGLAVHARSRSVLSEASRPLEAVGPEAAPGEPLPDPRAV